MAPESGYKARALRAVEENRRLRGKIGSLEDRLRSLEESYQNLGKELRSANVTVEQMKVAAAKAEAENRRRDEQPVYARPPNTVHYADGPRYKGGFGVPSDSSPGKMYIVSFDSAVGWWVCDCPAGKNQRQCKHRQRYDRPGPERGRQPTPQFVAPVGPAAPMPEPPAALRKIVRKIVRGDGPV